MTEEHSLRRLVENEKLFRSYNEAVKDVAKKNTSTSKKAKFFCECSDMECEALLTLTPKEYEEAHKNRKWFVIRSGHEETKVEYVAGRGEYFNIVEKFSSDAMDSRG